MMSFCGFFPADDPQYTLLVQMMYDNKQDTRPEEKRKKLGGGSSSALAFKEIAEKIMAKKLNKSIEAAIDTVNTYHPEVKDGNINEAEYVLGEFGIKVSGRPEYVDGEHAWGDIDKDKAGNIRLCKEELNMDTVPDVTGMGAKDALFLMHERGIEVRFEGYGKVISQSIAPGTKVNKGETARLFLAL
jgi:cell division protein FtsI (penicillin-binding protein 3)